MISTDRQISTALYVFSQAENVKDEDFVNWMRPSAVPRVPGQH